MDFFGAISYVCVGLTSIEEYITSPTKYRDCLLPSPCIHIMSGKFRVHTGTLIPYSYTVFKDSEGEVVIITSPSIRSENKKPKKKHPVYVEWAKDPALDKRLFDWLDEHPSEKQALLLGGPGRGATRVAKLTGNYKITQCTSIATALFSEAKSSATRQLVKENPTRLGHSIKGRISQYAHNRSCNQQLTFSQSTRPIQNLHQRSWSGHRK